MLLVAFRHRFSIPYDSIVYQHSTDDPEYKEQVNVANPVFSLAAKVFGGGGGVIVPAEIKELRATLNTKDLKDLEHDLKIADLQRQSADLQNRTASTEIRLQGLKK